MSGYTWTATCHSHEQAQAGFDTAIAAIDWLTAEHHDCGHVGVKRLVAEPTSMKQ